MTKTTFTARSQWEPDGLNPLTKFVIPERKIDEGKRQITFTISTGGRDRDGDIIEQSGWSLTEYQKNPVVLWAHDGRQPPIARAESVAVEGGRLISVARFAKREEYEFADTVFRLYTGGFLNATSVGFEPQELELIEGEEPGDIGFRFLRQKLLEYSAVPIPSNPEALVVARSAGIDVGPCEKWIEELLDEHKGGSVESLLNRCYIALKGRLHPVMQGEIAARNIAKLSEKSQPEKDAHDDDDEDEDDRAIVTTGNGGEDGHSHQFRAGDPQTEPGGEDGHVHAITYSDDGNATIEGTLGHNHDAPAGAAMPGGDDDDKAPHESDGEVSPGAESVSAAADTPETKITDWPQPGMSLPVSLLTSEYRMFPLAEAQTLRDDWPEIWNLVVHVDDQIFAGDSEKAIRDREAWAAKNVDGFQIEDIVAQVKHLVRGSRGIEHMRLMLSYAKEHVMNRRDRAKGLSPEEIDAITDRVVTTAVIPAIERAFRKYSGRVS